MTSSPGLARLRADPRAEQIRLQVLQDQQAARAAVVPPKRRITVLVARNPKRGKAAERFALYVTGMTVGAYIRAVGEIGTARADLRWDARQGYIKIG